MFFVFSAAAVAETAPLMNKASAPGKAAPARPAAPQAKVASHEETMDSIDLPVMAASNRLSTYSAAFLFSLLWWLVIVYFYINGVSSKTIQSCLASTQVITVLQMLPYKLHSPDIQSAVYTINKKFNVQTKFFDAIVPTLPAGAQSANKVPMATGAYAGQPWREYNKFTLNYPFPNSIAGSTNWMEYNIVFNQLSDVSPECLEPFRQFFFINADGSCQGCL